VAAGVERRGGKVIMFTDEIKRFIENSPQALTRIIVKVEKILAFCSGIHTDQPLAA
jgi:hypothetical protein